MRLIKDNMIFQSLTTFIIILLVSGACSMPTDVNDSMPIEIEQIPPPLPDVSVADIAGFWNGTTSFYDSVLLYIDPSGHVRGRIYSNEGSHIFSLACTFWFDIEKLDYRKNRFKGDGKYDSDKTDITLEYRYDNKYVPFLGGYVMERDAHWVGTSLCDIPRQSFILYRANSPLIEPSTSLP